MRKIRAVGFDMDFTLAQYNVAFDLLGYRGAQEKLVYKYGYPKEILAFQYNPALFRRGVVIDKARGNFLKVDRHKYVKTVFHGTRMLNSEQKRTLYLEYFDRMPSFSEKHYVAIDTLFQVTQTMGNLITLSLSLSLFVFVCSWSTRVCSPSWWT